MNPGFRALLLLLTLSFAAFAQSEAGGATLNGTVSDPSGAAVSGAKVTIANRETGLTRETVTSDTGLYSFVRLPVGNYDLNVEMQGFKKARKEAIELAVGAVLTFDVHLEVGAATESITVTSEVPIVETSRSQTSTAVNDRAVRDLPINGRNFLDFTVLTPGVVRDPRGGDLSFGGQRGTSNSLLIDGNDANNTFFQQATGRTGVRNPYAFSQESVAEFQVNTNSYAAELGRAGGGVINVVTKSGTNDVHGSAFWFLRQRFLNANTFINNSRSIPRQPYDFDQFGGTVGGPIVRNKVFFFTSYDGQRNKNNIAPTPALNIAPGSPQGAVVASLSQYFTPYLQSQDNDTFLGKVDWTLSDKDTLSVRYNMGRFTGGNFENGGPQRAQEATGDSKNLTDNVVGSYTRVLSPTALYDARVTWLRDNAPGEANAIGPEVNISEAGSRVISYGRNSFSPRYTNIKRFQTIHSVSLTRGSHSFKIGGDLNFDRIANFFPGNFSGVYNFNSLADYAARRPFNFTQGFAGEGTNGATTQPNINEYAFFAQDSWRTSDRLTLNYGIRYDLFDYAANNIRNPNQQLLAAGLRTDSIPIDKSNVAGRFGFAYRVTKSDRVLVRGGAGIFYVRTPAIVTGTSHSQNGLQVAVYTLSSTNPNQAPLIPAFPAILSAPPALARTPDIYVFDPNYRTPRSYQWSLNIETRLAADYLLTFGYLGVRGQNLTRTRDINLQTPETVSATITGGPGVDFLRFPGRVNPAFGRISLFESAADSIYNGGFIQLTKRYAQRFQILANYTYSKVIDTRPDATSVVVGADDSKQVLNTLNPRADRAVGDSDARHRAVISGTWNIDYARSLGNPVLRALLNDYQLGLITTLQSGRWFSASVAGDLNNDGSTSNERPGFLGRNTVEGPGFAALDVRFSRSISMWERARLQLLFEGFNITNRANFNNFDRTPYTYNATTRVFTPRAQYLSMTGSADPRILQLAVRLQF
jgi:hypothetical protein